MHSVLAPDANFPLLMRLSLSRPTLRAVEEALDSRACTKSNGRDLISNLSYLAAKERSNAYETCVSVLGSVLCVQVSENAQTRVCSGHVSKRPAKFL